MAQGPVEEIKIGESGQTIRSDDVRGDGAVLADPDRGDAGDGRNQGGEDHDGGRSGDCGESSAVEAAGGRRNGDGCEHRAAGRTAVR